ncbi:MAG: HlyD family efflux transporter periplasmic adaptor subunit [Clostridia bacterium]|nr:HlyD family efflux transporter periplasmic adaptor subunit [Clostridia bacterium]
MEKAYRTKRKKKFIRLVVSIIIIFFILLFIYKHYYNKMDYKTDILQQGKIEKIERYSGIITRDEKLYESPAYGQVILYSQEGDKISKGSKILSIVKSEQANEVDERLAKIDEEINEYYQRNVVDKIIKADIEKIQDKINSVQREIQTATKQQDMQLVEQKSKQLEGLLGKRSDMIAQSSENEYLQSLYEEKNQLMEKRQEFVKNIYSPEAGIVSYLIDGFEKVLTPDAIGDYTWQTVNNIMTKTENHPDMEQEINASVGQPLYKIIDNFKCYITIPIDRDYSKLLQDKSFIEIKIKDQFLETKILGINDSSEKSILNLELKYDIPLLWQSRVLDFDVKLQDEKGYKVPLESIKTNKGTTGIYILKNNFPQFVPVEILGNDENYAIIEGKDDNLKLFTEYITDANEIR